MGNCNCNPFGIDRKRVSRKSSRKIVLLLVGLDNSGKTSAAKSLIGEPVDSVVPTVGFSLITLVHRGFTVMIYDLGGGPQIRDIWNRYFTDVHGVIFVIDSSDVSRLGEGKEVLTNLLANEKIAGKPVLVLANKQDRDGALDELDIVEKFDLDALVNKHKCRTLVETCSTNQEKKQQLNPAIHNGYVWLLESIIYDYAQLNERVESDMALQKQLDDRERKGRRERITRLRAERGETDVADAGDAFVSNPFQPIDQLAAMKVVALDPSLNTRVILVKESSVDRKDSRSDISERRSSRSSCTLVGESPTNEENHEASLELKLNRSTSENMEDVEDLVGDGVILVKESPRRINNVDGRRSVESGRESASSKREVRTKSGARDRVSVLKSAERRENDYVEPGLILVRESPRKIVNVDEGEAEGDKREVKEPTSVTGKRDPFLILAHSVDVGKVNGVEEDKREVKEPTSVTGKRDPFLILSHSVDVGKVNSVNVSITEFVKDQLELERVNAHRKKRAPLRRANKTEGSRPASRENGLSPRSTKSPSSPLKKPSLLPPLKPLNHGVEGHWAKPPLTANPDLSWAIVTGDKAEKTSNHDFNDDSENIIKG